jgi:hypothetical protein
LKEIAGQQVGGKRKKRGVFNFVGELIKILFGTVDEDDVKYYDEGLNYLSRIQRM